MMAETKRLQAIIHGSVQGVGMRWWVRQQAQRLGLVGFVRNQPDGTVCVVAEGDDRSLWGLYDLLQQGPSMSLVEAVDVRWQAANGEFSWFEVRY